MSAFLDQLDELASSITIVSLDTYVWLGEPFVVPRRSGLDPMESLRVSIEARLYQDFYCMGGPVPASDTPDPRPDGMASERISGQQGAIAPSMALGTYVGSSGGDNVVEFAGVRFYCSDADVMSTGELRPGRPVMLKVPAEQLGTAGGFYTRLGAAGAPNADDLVDRYYWNVRPEARGRLLRALADCFDSGSTVFRVKVASDPRVWRCDACVLYCRSSERDRVRFIVDEVHRQFAGCLDPRVPVATLLLAPGLAFAEDPGDEGSFGTYLCSLLAEALIATRDRDPLSRRAELVGWLTRAGLDLEHPYRLKARQGLGVPEC